MAGITGEVVPCNLGLGEISSKRVFGILLAYQLAPVPPEVFGWAFSHSHILTSSDVMFIRKLIHGGRVPRLIGLPG